MMGQAQGAERLFSSLVFIALLPATAAAQQLFTFTDSEGPASVRAFSGSGDGDGIGPTVDPAAVSVQLDAGLLAAAPLRLVLPTRDGGAPTILERRHFEDREHGNVTWSGSTDGERHEHSLFTVHDGFTMGSFAVSGVRYSLLADADGRGVLTPEATVDPGEDWCQDHARDLLPGAQLPRYDPRPSQPARVASRSTNGGEHEIDILFVYVRSAQDALEDPNVLGGSVTVAATAQKLVDFANMVYRNTHIPVRLRVVGIEPDPWPVDVNGTTYSMLDLEFDYLGIIDREHMNALHALRREYDADLVHLLTLHWRAVVGGICGEASLYSKRMTPQTMAPYAYGATNVVCDHPTVAGPGFTNWTFVHELGHNFGAHHSREIPHGLSQHEIDNMPASVRADLCNNYDFCIRDETEVRAEYAYGALVNPRASDHHLPLGDGTWWPVAPDQYTCLSDPQTPGCPGADGTLLPDGKNAGAITVMGYNLGAHWMRVPYFSKAHMWIGAQDDFGLQANQYDAWLLGSEFSDVARLHEETAPDLASLSDYQYRLSRAPSEVSVTTRRSPSEDGMMEITVEFNDNSTDESSFHVEVRAKERGSLPSEHVCPTDPGVWWPCKWGDSTGRRSYTFTRHVVPGPLLFRVAAVNDDGPTLSGDYVETVGIGRPEKPTLGTPEFHGADLTVDVAIGQDTEGEILVELVMCPCSPGPQGGAGGVISETTWADSDGKVAFPFEFGEDYQLFAAAQNQYGHSVTDLIDVKAPAKAAGKRPTKPAFTKLTYNTADSTMTFRYNGISSDTETLRLSLVDLTAWEETKLWSVLGDLKVPAKGKGKVSTPYVPGHNYRAVLEATNGAGVTQSDTFRFSSIP